MSAHACHVAVRTEKSSVAPRNRRKRGSFEDFVDCVHLCADLVEKLGVAGDAVRLCVDGLERVLRELLEAVGAYEVVRVESLAERVDAAA